MIIHPPNEEEGSIEEMEQVIKKLGKHKSPGDNSTSSEVVQAGMLR